MKPSYSSSNGTTNKANDMEKINAIVIDEEGIKGAKFPPEPDYMEEPETYTDDKGALGYVEMYNFLLKKEYEAILA